MTELTGLRNFDELLRKARSYDFIAVLYSYNFTDPGSRLIRALAALGKPLLFTNGGSLHLGGAPGSEAVPGAVLPQLLTAESFLLLQSELGQQRSAAVGVHQGAPTARLAAAAADALHELAASPPPRTGDATPLEAARRAAALAARGVPQHLESLGLLLLAIQPLADALHSASLLPRPLRVFDAFGADTPAPAMAPQPQHVLGCARVSTAPQSQRLQVTVVADATATVVAARGMDASDATVALAKPASALLLRREQCFMELPLHIAHRDPATADFIGSGERVDLAGVDDACIVTSLRNFGCRDFVDQLDRLAESGNTELLCIDHVAGRATLPQCTFTASGASNIGNASVRFLLGAAVELVVIGARIFMGQQRNALHLPALERMPPAWSSLFAERQAEASSLAALRAAPASCAPGGARAVVLEIITCAGEAGELGAATTAAMLSLAGTLFPEDKPPVLFALSRKRYVPGGSAFGAATAAEWAAAHFHATAAGMHLVDAARLDPLINMFAAFFGNMDFAIRFMASLMHAIYFTTVLGAQYFFGFAAGGGLMHFVSRGVMLEVHVGRANGVPVFLVRRAGEQPRAQAVVFVEAYALPLGGGAAFADVPAAGPSAPAAVAHQATAQPGPYPRSWTDRFALVFLPMPEDAAGPPPPLPTEEEAEAAVEAEEAAAAEAAEEREARAEALPDEQDTAEEEAA